MKHGLDLKNWWTATELAGLPGMPATDKGVREKAWRESWYDRDRADQGGGREFHFDSLPIKTRLYLIEQAEEARKAANPGQAIEEINAIEADQRAYANAPTWAKEQADRCLFVLNACDGLKGKDLDTFTEAWNEKHPQDTISDKSIYRWRKKLAEHGQSGLLPAWGNRKGDTAIKKEWFDYFVSHYLDENQRSTNIVWHSTLGEAAKKTPGLSEANFPIATTFFRKLENEFSKDYICLRREGFEAWNKKYASYIDRDYSNLKAGEAWVGDHHQIDVGAKTKAGKNMFPWITAWRDWKTGKMLSWFTHADAPNSDHIFQSFYYAAERFGLPKVILIDNGKDYRCKDFAGGRINKTKVKVTLDVAKTTPMLLRLGITPRFALPYNAQAKPIERDFRNFKDWFAKSLPGYRGGNVVERPEKCDKDIKQGLLLDFEDEFLDALNSFVENIFNKMPSRGKVLQGRSRDQVWNEEFKISRQVRKEALMLFCMRSTGPLSIGRNGVRDTRLEASYWNDWMAGYKGEKVYMRRDPKAWHEAWVFNAETDEFMGMAELQKAVEVLAEEPTSRKSLEAGMARKNHEKRVNREITKSLRKPIPGEFQVNLQNALKMINGTNDQPAPVLAPVIQIQNTKMDQVVLEKERMETAGKADVSTFSPKVLQFPKKTQFYTSQADKDADEKRAREAQNNG